MEIGVIFAALCLVVITKGITVYWIGQLQARLRELEKESADVRQKLYSAEATQDQQEREKNVMEQGLKLMENDKDLLCQKIVKLGEKPVSEDEIDVMPDVEEEGQAEPAPDEEGAEESEGKAAAGPTSGAAEQGAESDAKGAEPKRRVLVVDDEPEMSQMLQKTLASDYDVSAAGDGYEALTKLTKGQEQFDVIITDLKMPKMNGITLVQQLPADIPTIIISGYLHMPAFKRALQRLNPVAILQKPFEIDQIRQAVGKAVGKPVGEVKETADG
ncbi:MAG: response regulator [Candidatus Latescibacteria bacterium]|jgi:CheY-like chemotaxis protein|nr:response regulator [Candidatus Latescibacterota bacterium]